MAKKKANQTKRITNSRARFDYALDDSYVVGIQLTGAETKALRMGMGNLKGAYVSVVGDELFLINAMISGNNSMPISEDDKTRSRKLLAKRSEIDAMLMAKKTGMTIVPTELLTKGRYIKLRIATGRGLKKYDKREVIKKRDQLRDAQRDTS